MKAAVLRQLGESLTIENIDLPRLGRGHVLVHMQQSAVCHSQKLEVSGRRGPDRFLPHLVGHEGIGMVLDVGPDVTKVHAGDQVILSWIRGSGVSAEPIQYASRQGTVNAGPIATFCETPIVAEQCVTKITTPVSPDDGVLVGCALPTGAGTVWKAVPADVRGSVCILGAGGVGLSALAGAVCDQWRQRIVVDLKPSRLQRAREIGATHTICAATDDVMATIKTITEGQWCDLVVECAGAKATMEMALRLGKTTRSYVVIAGNLTTGDTFAVDPFDLIRGRILTGSWGGWVNPDTDFAPMLDRVRSCQIRSELLRGDRFTLDGINDALRALDGESPGRPIIEFPPSL